MAETTDIHVVEDGAPDSPAVLLIHGSAASMVYWEPVLPALTGALRVIRVDVPGCGRSAPPADGYELPVQARRIGALLDRLGVRRVTVVGHSSGSMMATALAEERPDIVAAVVIIDMGPDLAAQYPESPLVRLLLAPLTGRLLWRLRTESAIRKAASTAFTRPVEIPAAYLEAALSMTYQAFAGTYRANADYLRQRSLSERLAPLGLPLLVVFGAEDRRCRSSSAVAYRAVPGARIEVLPGVGHTPMLEDTEATSRLLLDFATAVGQRA
jgi:pimeloyl-ACP methyl ester carboxylesterase